MLVSFTRGGASLGKSTSKTSRHRSVIFKMAGKFVVRYFFFFKKCRISYGLDDLFTLLDVTQDSKDMRDRSDLFAIVSSSTECSKASNFDWKPIVKQLIGRRSLFSC